MKLRAFVAIGLLLLCAQLVQSQNDTLVFKGGQTLVGEIKKMEKAVLEIDVPYGDSNFKIKWLDVEKIRTTSNFVVGIKNKVYEGRLATMENGTVNVYAKDKLQVSCSLNDIVYLHQFKDGFSNRFSAAVEAGFNLTKAQNVRQFSFRSSVGYKTDKFETDASYNIIRSSQDSVEPVRRTDGLLNYRRLLFRKWYAIATISTLSNTEQKIDLRANTQIGIGNYIFAINKAYWGVKIGVNNNLEKFANESESRNSWEGYLGTELNLYDTGDLNLSVVLMGYKGFTDSNRYRADGNIDLKYDLPLDLFVRLGFSFNYDNEPTINASTTDYILRTGIGWEW